MSGKDYLGKVKDQRSLLERIMGYIPGYHGYKEKELRRESDRLVRMDVVNRLKAAKTVVRKAFADPAMVQKLDSEGAYRFDTLTYRLDRITQRIDRAVAGYTGFFDAVKVKEDKLDSILQYDADLIEKADSIKTDCTALSKMPPGNDAWNAAADALISKIDEYDSLIDTRSDILRGLEG
jgi:hypothetical protein